MARYAEDARDRSTCPMCKGPLDECSDEHKTWFPQRLICHKTMELEASRRKWAALHDARPFHDGSFTSWSEKRDEAHPVHFDDGVRLWVADFDYDPDATWLSASGLQDGEDDDGGDSEP